MTAPPERVMLPVMELALKAPPRFSVPVLSTCKESPAPLEDQEPAVVSAPALAHKVPSLVQLVPVTVMVEAASSALMVPWLARPSEAEPTTPLLVPWIRMPAPISNMLPALLERTTLPAKVPPKTISPVPLMAWVALPSNTRLVLKPTLFVLFSVTLPPASTSPPSAMLSVDALPTITSPASVMLLSVAVVDPARVALVPPLVASVPFWISAPLPSVRLPPCTVNVPPFMFSVWLVLLPPPPVASESAFSTRFNCPAEDEIPALTLMLLCADSVSVALPPAVLLMASATVMFPASVPPALVVMVTLVPALRAASIVATVTMAASPVVEMVPGGVPVTLVSDPMAWMVTLLGSSSHRPPLPTGALASAARVTSSMRLPEVSIRPPSPPQSPPRAEIMPCTRAVSLAHTTTLPPLPEAVALAISCALAASVVNCALRTSGLSPCQSPPTRISPPP